MTDESTASRGPRPARLLLHACCGPCLIEPLEALSAEADEVAIVYANPNIHPAAEYMRRRDTLCVYAERLGIQVIETAYDPALWLEVAGPFASDPARRCRACYRLRLGQSARIAAENGYDAIATTLTVSPFQDPEAIREEGERAASEAGVTYLHRDFRDRYAQATRRSRELAMYRQNYCGCLMSDIEAAGERAERRAARPAQKAAPRGGERE